MRSSRSSSGARIAVASALIAVLGWSTRADAQAPPPQPSAEGALIRQGLELREKGDDEAALRVFRQAHDLSNGARALAQVALAEQALGRWVDAEAHLNEALGRGDDAWIVRNKALLGQAVSELQDRLGWLRLSSGEVPAEVLVNGRRVGYMPLPGPLRVPAGSVALEARASGYLSVIRNVIVPARGTARETIVLIAEAAPSTTGPVPRAQPILTQPADVRPPPSDGWSTRKSVGVVMGLTGLASLSVGIAFTLIHNKHADDFNSDCHLGLPNYGSPGCTSTFESARRAETVAIVGYVGSAALIGLGIYLFLTDPEPAPARARASIGLRCVPSMDLGLACGGRF